MPELIGIRIAQDEKELIANFSADSIRQVPIPFVVSAHEPAADGFESVEVIVHRKNSLPC